MDKNIYVDWIDKVKILQKAVIKNKEGKILAVRRPADAAPRPRPNCWDLPGGRVEKTDIEKWKSRSGKGDKNDILINALKREIKEEANLDVKNIRAIQSASGFDETKNIFVVAIGYTCDALNENGLKLSPEHSEYKWVSKDEFAELDIGNDGGLIRSILGKTI
jgi:8-oxo-dGTP pyrophosphatase MutT (NUDIX family)